eukprot:455158-Amorphochlora_amoeboformis.AAC.1
MRETAEEKQRDDTIRKREKNTEKGERKKGEKKREKKREVEVFLKIDFETVSLRQRQQLHRD